MSSKETVAIKFAELVDIVNHTNDDFDNFLVHNKITSGRDFRRSLRNAKRVADEAIKLSLELEKGIREDKKAKKELKKNAG